MAASRQSFELQPMKKNSINYNYPRDKSIEQITIERIVEVLSDSPFPTQSESCRIALKLPNSNIGSLLQQADNNLNFWGVLTTPEKQNGIFIQTRSEKKLVVVFNDNGAIRFAFLEGRYAEFAIQYTRFLPFRNNPLWNILINAFGE
jgi:hypothetical protein